MKYKLLSKGFLTVAGFLGVFIIGGLASYEGCAMEAAGERVATKFGHGSLAAGDVIEEWNQIAISRVLGAGLPAPRQLRAMAIVHVSVHDAVNGLTRQYET